MDKAQEKQLIQDIFGFGAIYPRGLAQHLLVLGYRKLPKDKPPLLGETELDYWWRRGLAKESDHLDAAREVAQAQRDSDIKHYSEAL